MALARRSSVSTTSGTPQAAELLAQAEMLEENLRWMSDERYQASSRKQMLYETRATRRKRR